MDETIKRAIDDSLAEMMVASGEDIYLVETAVRAGGRIIELTVDTDQGIGVRQCARLSRLIRGRLEACEENSMFAGGEFELMVSSPGIGEPVRVKRQYRRHLGRLFRITCVDVEGQRKEIDGRLVEASVEEDVDPSITIVPVMAGKKRKKEDIQQPVTMRLADVVKAVVQIEW